MDNNYEFNEDDTRPIHTDSSVDSTQVETTYGQEPAEDNQTPWGKIIAGALIALGLLALIGWFIFQGMNKGDRIVPTASNELLKDAQTTCEPFEKNDLQCSVDLVFSEEVSRDSLISQSVAPNEKVPAGTKIDLAYSRGPETSKFPDITGMTVEEAQKALYAIGVDIETVNVVDDPEVERDHIVSASTETGATVKNGDTVTVNVSSGSVELPNWVGKQADEATKEAQDLGLDVKITEEESDKEEGTVIAQTPQPGEVDSSATVELTIAVPFEVKSANIPNVIGMSPDDANATLSSAGFRNISVIEQSSEKVSEPSVTQIIPGVNDSVKTDTSIVIVVSYPTEEAPSSAPQETQDARGTDNASTAPSSSPESTEGAEASPTS